MNAWRIDVDGKAGRVTLNVGVGPMAVTLVLKPLEADSLAGALTRAAIQANAPAALVVPAPANGHHAT